MFIFEKEALQNVLTLFFTNNRLITWEVLCLPHWESPTSMEQPMLYPPELAPQPGYSPAQLRDL
jgi:hypothetical protein